MQATIRGIALITTAVFLVIPEAVQAKKNHSLFA